MAENLNERRTTLSTTSNCTSDSNEAAASLIRSFIRDLYWLDSNFVMASESTPHRFGRRSKKRGLKLTT